MIDYAEQAAVMQDKGEIFANKDLPCMVKKAISVYVAASIMGDKALMHTAESYLNRHIKDSWFPNVHFRNPFTGQQLVDTVKYLHLLENRYSKRTY